jgi:hypothetical protein
MTASDLYQCVQMAQSDGWNGGVMFWEWTGVGDILTGNEGRTDSLIGSSNGHGDD